MKKIAFIALMAGVVFCGCNHRKAVDETVETDRYTMHIQDAGTFGKYRFFWNSANDSTVICNTVPEMALYLASMTQGPRIDSTTMWTINVPKQSFLMKYVFTILDHDTTQADNYTPLLQTLIDRGFLRADTTYEPMQLLEVYDSARLAAYRLEKVADDEKDIVTLGSIVVRMRACYRKPVTPAPGLDIWMRIDDEKWNGDKWRSDSLWLDDAGLRLVADPQGRQLRIVEFNRQKGKI